MSYIETNKQSFGNVAKDYKKYRGTYNDALFKVIFSMLKNKKQTLSILDLGCGVGNSTEPLYKMAKKLKIQVQIKGCDPDEAMLEQGVKSAKRQKLNIQYVQGSAENIPFENQSFDMVISGAAFHWFATKQAAKEIKRVLKPEGRYFIFWTQSAKNNSPVVGNELYKKYKFQGIPKELRDPKTIKKLLTDFGFKNVVTKKVPYTEIKTTPEAIGLIKTNSGYAVLSPSDKRHFIKAMTLEYKKAFGTKKHQLNRSLTFVMVRFKK